MVCHYPLGMNFHSMSNQSISAEIGRRIEQLRLEQNLTQKQIADEVGLSTISYRKLVCGGGKFENIIAVLRALNHLDFIENFIPETQFSPMELLKLRGKQRKRASKKQPFDNNEMIDELDW